MKTNTGSLTFVILGFAWAVGLTHIGFALGWIARAIDRHTTAVYDGQRQAAAARPTRTVTPLWDGEDPPAAPPER